MNSKGRAQQFDTLYENAELGTVTSVNIMLH